MNTDTETETPELDKIPLPEWLNTSYTFLQKKEIESLIKNHVWITAFRKKLFVVKMETSHVINCIRCWEGKGNMRIPIGYLGGKEKWLKIFNEELIRRN